MNILIVNESGMYGGGAENRIRLLVEELQKRKEIEKITVMQFEEGSLKKKKLEIVYCQKDSEKAYILIKRLIKEHKIDLVQFHNLSFVSPIKAAKEMKVKTIFFSHDYWPVCGYRSFIPPHLASKKDLCYKTGILKCIKCIGLRSYFRVLSYKKMVDQTDIGIAPGCFVKEMYEKHDVLKNRWEIVKPWLNLKLFLKKSAIKRDNSMVFLGSLIDYKGAYLAVQALKNIIKEVPDAELKLIGPDQEKDNKFRKKIERLAEEDGTINKIKFLGKLSSMEISKIYQKAGVYVCSTVCMELFGQNWAEAMASGCPVVGSDAGSLPEFIREYGIIVPSKNPKALANAVINVLTDKKLADRLSRDGISYIKQFNVKNAANKMIQIYQELVSEQPL